MSPAKPLRILCLHGYTQNPTLFSAKTAALRKTLTKVFSQQKGFDIKFSYPAGPLHIAPAEIPGYDPETTAEQAPQDEPEALGWWVMRGSQGGIGSESKGDIIYDGVEKSMAVIAECICSEGPFDGVIGFSQGAAAAAMVASMLEGSERLRAFDTNSSSMGGMPLPEAILTGQGPNRRPTQPPLKFAVCYSGFKARDSRRCAAFYEPKIQTPVLHVLGEVDVVVESARSQGLVDVCEGGPDRVVVHPGGHFVPSQKPMLDVVVGFIKSCIDEGESTKKQQHEEEEAVEDMEVPF